jgi:hypothetical protein
MLFQIGQKVRWSRLASIGQAKQLIGVIKDIIADDHGIQEFTMYDVQFGFGLFTLHGTQLVLLDEQIPRPAIP